jgi:hypothetical protein
MAKPVLHRLDHVTDANILQALHDCTETFPASCTQIVMQVAKNHGFKKPTEYDLGSLCSQMGFRVKRLLQEEKINKLLPKPLCKYLVTDQGRKVMNGQL